MTGTSRSLRNCAMIRILVYTGLRRSELVALVVEKTTSAAGLGKLASYCLRRKLITAGLESGGHLRDLHELAGHANAATTLSYAQASDARARREKIRLPFA